VLTVTFISNQFAPVVNNGNRDPNPEAGKVLKEQLTKTKFFLIMSYNG